MSTNYELAALPILSIDPGERRREDYGDLESFGKSFDISQGIMSTLLVERNGERYKLIAGGRRFYAALLRGDKDVPARILPGTSSPAMYRLMELVENLARKDFNWQERIKAELDIQNLFADKERGWTQRKTAALLGVDETAISRDLSMAKLLLDPMAPDQFKNATTLDGATVAWAAWKKDKHRTALANAAVARASVASEARGEAKNLSGPESLLYLRDHYVVGDALAKMTLLADETFDFLEVDPPYGIDYDKMSSSQTYVEVSDANYSAFLNTICTEAYRVAKPESFMVLWQAVQRYQMSVDALTSAGWKVCAVPLIWTKPGASSLNAITLQMSNSYEVAFYAHKGVPKLAKYGCSNVFVYPTVPPSRRVHATERPLELMKDVLGVFCDPGAMVLVPFLGSGVTLLAAATLHMQAVGFDISQQHKDNFIAKLSSGWNSYTNTEAKGEQL